MTDILIIPASVLALVGICVAIIAYLSNYVGKVAAYSVIEAEKAKLCKMRRQKRG